MRLLNIFVERFGILEDSSLSDLSPGLTVVYGPNGSGKSTLVTFFEGLLFGFDQQHEGYQPTNQDYGGAGEFEYGGRAFRLLRERKHGYTQNRTAVDLTTGRTLTTDPFTLPQWVNETVFKEIFSVGHHEADRFDLLNRLCLQDSGTSASQEEIRRTELAISNCVGEREGQYGQPGIHQQILDLQGQRRELIATLERMQQVSPHIPARIAEIEAEIGRLRSSLVSIEQQIQHVEEQIRKLELRIEELRRRNTVSLNRQQLERQLSDLQARQQRWDEIRRSINGEIGALQQSSQGLKNRDSLKSVRALVSRLEERMDALSDERLINAPGTSQEVFVDHLRSEVYSLCDYVAQHESAVEAHEAELEKLFGQRTLQDAENVNTVLQGQIDACREELNRCEDILHIHAVPKRDCESRGHMAFRRNSAHPANGSLDELETELRRLRRQLDTYQNNDRDTRNRIRDLEAELIQRQGQIHHGASLEEIDRVKAQIAGLDSKLDLLEQRSQVLNQTETNLREVLARLQQHRKSQVLELASSHINRLTDGDCFELIADESHTTILARTRQANYPLSFNQLSHGTREQVGLALRLALIQCRATDNQRCPLLLDDVFISADDERAIAVADLLIDVANAGQQIVFFTCQKDVRDLFDRRGVTVRSLTHAPKQVPVPPPEIKVVPEPEPQPVLTLPVPPAPTPPPVATNNTNWLYYLEVDNSVEDLSGLSVAEVEAIRAVGLETIDELLNTDVDSLESRFRDRGYSISRTRIRALRGQAEMSLLVPMLRRSDAELLYAAGIESIVELGRMRPETVYERVTEFQQSQDGHRFRRSGRSIDRQQAINWSRWSQHSRPLSEARRSRSRFFVRGTDVQNSPHASSNRRSSVDQRRERMKASGSSTRRQPRPILSDSDRQDRDRRQSERRRRMAQHSSSYRTRNESLADSESVGQQKLRFYLNRSDDVEAAPSIGPKTAQRLAKVGIYTVDDLLNAHAEDIAARLDNRRISAETIVQWQGQARLVCTVPELRGHDSQILVACGVTEAEQLSAKRPIDLFSVVGPFAETAEGERIIRGGKKPDLEEVTDWVRFAQSSRSLRSAA